MIKHTQYISVYPYCEFSMSKLKVLIHYIPHLHVRLIKWKHNSAYYVLEQWNMIERKLTTGCGTHDKGVP